MFMKSADDDIEQSYQESLMGQEQADEVEPALAVISSSMWQKIAGLSVSEKIKIEQSLYHCVISWDTSGSLWETPSEGLKDVSTVLREVEGHLGSDLKWLGITDFASESTNFVDLYVDICGVEDVEEQSIRAALSLFMTDRQRMEGMLILRQFTTVQREYLAFSAAITTIAVLGHLIGNSVGKGRICYWARVVLRPWLTEIRAQLTGEEVFAKEAMHSWIDGAALDIRSLNIPSTEFVEQCDPYERLRVSG